MQLYHQLMKHHPQLKCSSKSCTSQFSAARRNARSLTHSRWLWIILQYDTHHQWTSRADAKTKVFSLHRQTTDTPSMRKQWTRATAAREVTQGRVSQTSAKRTTTLISVTLIGSFQSVKFVCHLLQPSSEEHHINSQIWTISKWKLCIPRWWLWLIRLTGESPLWQLRIPKRIIVSNQDHSLDSKETSQSLIPSHLCKRRIPEMEETLKCPSTGVNPETPSSTQLPLSLSHRSRPKQWKCQKLNGDSDSLNQ